MDGQEVVGRLNARALLTSTERRSLNLGAAVGRARLGAILSFAILSHLLLDLVTHNGDIALGPFHGAPKYGTFLYGRLAPLAFLVELAYGLVTVILVQIVITMWAVWWGAGKVSTDAGSNRDEHM